MGKRNLTVEPIPLTLGARSPTGYLYAAYVLQLDPEGLHLTVTKSQYGIYADTEKQEMLVHWDYEREPPHDYPAAHVQVNGACEVLELLADGVSRFGLTPTRDLRNLHFPVGGRRFRPTLEEVVEFLIVEQLAHPREGWQDVIAEHREQWEERQLRAAVRRHPEIAIAQLREDERID